MTFHHATLDNGLDVVAELNPSVHSVAFGFFVKTGSRDETPDVHGVSHFLEHMVFKGTARYSADDVNRLFDEVGADYNAATSEEATLFYAAVLPEYLPKTFALQAAILRPALRDDDFETEKQVILEEIGMYDDQPSYVAYDQVMQSHFSGHPLGRTVLGTTASITNLTAEQMRAYHAERYRAGNIVLAVAGRADWPEIVALAQTHCGAWPGGSSPRSLQPAHPRQSSRSVVRPPLQQQQVVQLAEAPDTHDPARYAAELLAVIVGDDQNSRLFWELVDPGHAELAELSYNDYDDAGAFMFFLSGDPGETRANLDRAAKVFESVNRAGITDEELRLAKTKVASRIVLRGERPMGRLSSLGGNWLARREYRSVVDDLKTVEAITRDDVRRVLERFPLSPLTTVSVGPVSIDGSLNRDDLPRNFERADVSR
jgi:predicted Zn-dependent peptidase